MAAAVAAAAGCTGPGYQPGPRPMVSSPWTDVDPGDDPSWELYAPDEPIAIDLELSAESMASLERAPKTYAPARFRRRDEVVDRVGVRLKGGSTFRDLDGKPSFKIDFDAFVAGQRFHGLEHMTLNNGVGDPSRVSERLAYELFRAAGVPAPRANHAVVRVNGAPYGLYVNVETEDEVFLARWFADATGNLYEGADADFTPGNHTRFELETNRRAGDRADLEALIDAVAAARGDRFASDVAAHLDVARFLRYCALEAVVSQWDGYALSRLGLHNFRAYRDPQAGAFELIPWDLDLAMRPLFPPELVHPSLPDDSARLSAWEPRGVLLARCLEGAACRDAYRRALDDAADVFESADLRTRALAMYWQIERHVRADPRAEVDVDTFEYTFDLVLEHIDTRADQIRAEAARR